MQFKIKRSWIITLASILFGFIIGGIVLAVAGYDPFRAYGVIWNGTFSKPLYIVYTIIYATPIIMTGLSVAFAFRTGLFNIGAEGQFILGALAGALIGGYFNLPPVLHVLAALCAGMIVGGLWAALSGWLKAKFGVHEVISTIMLNWIALYFSNFIVTLEGIKRPVNNATRYIADTASLQILGTWKSTDAGLAWRDANPFFGDILRAPVNLGIFVAIILAIVVWFILNRTRLGFELRAIGFNPSAAEAGGIKVKKGIVASMAIAGALAGIAGAAQVLGNTLQVAELAGMEGNGLDGIAVALVGANAPSGCVLAGLLFAALKYGGSKIQNVLGAPSEIINIMMGTILFFIAIPTLIKQLIPWRKKGDGNAR